MSRTASPDGPCPGATGGQATGQAVPVEHGDATAEQRGLEGRDRLDDDVEALERRRHGVEASVGEPRLLGEDGGRDVGQPLAPRRRERVVFGVGDRDEDVEVGCGIRVAPGSEPPSHTARTRSSAPRTARARSYFDRVAAERLDKDLPIITEPHAARKLTSQGSRRPIALRNWETQRVVRGDTEVAVTSLPGKHAPDPLGFLIPPTMGSMLELRRGGETAWRIYVTGDTLVHDRLREVPERYPEIGVRCLPLCGPEPRCRSTTTTTRCSRRRSPTSRRRWRRRHRPSTPRSAASTGARPGASRWAGAVDR